jgi:hypothetical protein
VRFAIEVEADDAHALDALVTETEKWLTAVGATILERTRDDDDLIAAFVIRSGKDLRWLHPKLPGKVSIEPLD